MRFHLAKINENVIKTMNKFIFAGVTNTLDYAEDFSFSERWKTKHCS